MNSGIQVNFELVSELGSSLEAATQKIGVLLDNLNRDVEALRPKWTGQAATAYETAQVRWLRQLSAMNDVLSQYSVFAERASASFAETESRAGREW